MIPPSLPGIIACAKKNGPNVQLQPIAGQQSAAPGAPPALSNATKPNDTADGRRVGWK
jgi:hypothetical protein